MAPGSNRRNRRTSSSVPVDRRDFQEGVRAPQRRPLSLRVGVAMSPLTPTHKPKMSCEYWPPNMSSGQRRWKAKRKSDGGTFFRRQVFMPSIYRAAMRGALFRYDVRDPRSSFIVYLSNDARLPAWTDRL